MSILIAVVLSYLIGSVSPSYILARLTKGIDIRSHGDRNAGALNAIEVIGALPGILTALLDLSKGLACLFIAEAFLGLQGNMLLVPVFAAVAGHVFPFYLGFRGGQGAATAAGVLLYFLGRLLAEGRLPLQGILFMVLLGGLVALASRNAELIGFALIPFLLYLVLRHGGLSFPGPAAALLVLYLQGVTVRNFIRKGSWRSAGFDWISLGCGAAGILFGLCLFALGKLITALAAGAAAVLMLSLALAVRRARGGSGGRRQGGRRAAAAKDGGSGGGPSAAGAATTEGALLQGASLAAALLVVLAFTPGTALLSILILAGGDLLAGLLASGAARPIARSRLPAAAAAYAAGCLAAAYVAASLLPVGLPRATVAAVLAAGAALLPPALLRRLFAGASSALAATALRAAGLA